MYEYIEGGRIIDIQGLKCCLPPVGYVVNVFTKKLEYTGVYERSPIKEEQYWEPPAFPDWYKDTMRRWDAYDKKKKDDDPDFYDERLEEFKGQEWFRRLNGFWYKNNGDDVYLTGLHYFILRYWHIDIGLGKFRMPDLEKAYFWQYCFEDPLCMGMVEVTKRRFGKSYWAGATLTEYISRTKMANGGIQSKTGKDAKKFFGKTVVNPFRRLPRFFRPEYDTGLGQNPKTEIRFQKTNIKGKRSESNIDKDELGSLIDFGSSDIMDYDGQKLQIYIGDEEGKTVECNVYERHEVVRYCLLDDEGRIVGKALLTTTVEKLDSDKDGVQDAFKLIWDQSDQNNKGEDGRTPSGLYRFFMSSRKTRNFDRYGYPDEGKTLKAILADRATVKKNPRALSARIRKEPLTIEEAFSTDTDKCIFNTINIDAREQQLIAAPVFARSVLFERDITGKVVWRDIRKDEEDFCWKITRFPAAGQENKFIYDSGLRKPARTRVGAIAIDGYSNSQGGKFGSRASAMIGLRFDLNDQENTRKVIGHLHGRPSVKDTLHEQVMLAAEYYGFQAFYEHNSDDYDSYFRGRGRTAYLGIYPLSLIDPIRRAEEKLERHRGVPTTPFSLTKQSDMGIAYFESYSHLIDFPEILKDAKTFDPNERTKSDITVSFLMIIVIIHETVREPAPPPEPLIPYYPNKPVAA